MCGPSASQNTVQSSQIDLMKQLSQENSTVYGESQGILSSLNAAFQPILKAGVNQTGFSNAEDTSLNTEATEQTAQNYNQAQRTLQENQSAEGGGNSFEPSGGQAEQNASLAEVAAGAQSSAQQNNLQQNYAQGRQNFYNASGALGNVASEYNPTGTAANATGAGSAAANTANTIAQQSTSVWTSVLGALGGIAGDAAKGATQGAMAGG